MSLLDNLYVNLRVISKIPENGRISTTSAGHIKIEDTLAFGGWVTTGRRMLTGDSRDESVKVLMQTINDATELSDNIIDSLRMDTRDGNVTPAYLNENSKKCHNLQKLGVMLKASKKGIVNLYTTTYSEDANTTARLDEVLDKIDQQCQTITDVLEYMKNHHNASHVHQVPQSVPHVPQSVSVPHVPQSVSVPHVPQSVPHVPHVVPQSHSVPLISPRPTQTFTRPARFPDSSDDEIGQDPF